MRDFLYDKQTYFLDLNTDKKLFLGGRQTGKTTTLAAEGVEAAIEDGLDVLFFTPKQMMADGAIDTARTIAFDHFDKMSLKTNTKHKLAFNSGGTISVNTYHQIGRGRVSIDGYDLLLFDEVQELSVDDLRSLYEYQYEPSKSPSNPYPIEGFYAAATPPFTEPLEYLKEKDFEIVTVPTTANPHVNRDFLAQRREEMATQAFQNEYLVGPMVDDHWLSIHEVGGERTIECPLCDFEEVIPLDHPDENVAAAEGYVFGKAQAVNCG